MIFLQAFNSTTLHSTHSCIGVMVSMITSNVLDHRFYPQSDQTKEYENGICSLSFKYTALRNNDKNLLTQSWDNVSEWTDMSVSC
jgi:hypothetical protein